jgi:hypothetical protein
MSAAIFTQHGINTAKVSNATHTGDVTDASGVLTVDGINGVELAPLGTGILRLANGVPSIATEAQFPTLNQSTTGNANTATTATNLAGGGVGQVPYQTGSGATAMLAAGTAGYVLKSNGSAAPSWSQVNISSETTGTLPVASGGSGAATFTAGVLKANGTSAFTTVAAPSGGLVGTTDIQTLTNKTFGSGTTFSNPISVGNGGTGASTFTAGILTANGANAFSTTPAPSGDLVGTTAAQTITNKTFGINTVFSTSITAASGGTGQTSYVIGDILYADTSSSLAKLPDVIAGNVLISGGVGIAPSYGKVGLTTHVSGTLPVANGGTGVTTSTGSGGVVLSTSPTLVTPILGTPTSGTLTSCTGLPLTTGVTGTLPVANGGTGVTTSTGSGGVVLSTSPTLVTPILGTPTSGTLTSCTGLPLTTGVTGVLPVANGGTGVTAASTGSGGVVLSTSPTLVTPLLGTPTSGTLTNCTGLPLTTGVTGTLPVAKGGTGVTQSGFGELYVSSSTATTYPSTNTWYKVAGTTILAAGENMDDASGTNNRLRYTGSATRTFFITVCGTVTGSNGDEIDAAIALNGAHIDSSITIVTVKGSGDRVQFSCQCLVDMATNEYVELLTQNQSSTSSATFEKFNICALALV